MMFYTMKKILTIAGISFGILSPFSSVPAWCQDDGLVVSTGRWVPLGTFAISNLPFSDVRDQSYAGSNIERRRIATFLPAMTIVYRTVPSEEHPGYLTGTTQSGIPVHVLKRELSTGKFSDRDTKDVVTHRSHDGCRNLACTGDPITVPAGGSYSIVEEHDDHVILNNNDEALITYAREVFEDRERRGFITRHKGRISPRWTIADGYASHLATKCGEKRSLGDLVASVDEYAENPTIWEVNDKRWSLKAIEIFDFGNVRQEGQEVVGRLVAPIAPNNDQAIDLTVFAYRDSSWKPTYFKFAGIMQIVQCLKNRASPRVRPAYVKEAYIYFDKREGDDYVQEFPLQEYELPRQMSAEAQKKIFNFITRSFYYSVNSSKEYEDLFEQLSDVIQYPTAVANVIARLNASCSARDRHKCRKYSSAGVNP